jgi:hypothetical protein
VGSSRVKGVQKVFRRMDKKAGEILISKGKNLALWDFIQISHAIEIQKRSWHGNGVVPEHPIWPVNLASV